MAQDNGTVVVLPPIGSDEEAVALLGLSELDLGARRTTPYFYPGQAGRPRSPGLTFGMVADEVAANTDGPLDVVAIAIGAYAAAELLMRHPARVRSVFIAAAGFAPTADPEARARDRARAGQVIEGGWTTVLDTTLARWFTPAALRAGHDGVRYARERLLAMDPPAWSDIWLAIADRITVSEEDFARIAQPVSLVAPLHDEAGGLPVLARMHALIPRSRLHYVDGPHMVGLERPRNLQAALDQHFAWIADGGHRIESPLYSAGE